MVHRRVALVLAATAVAMGFSATGASADNIRLQATTDIRDSGIFDEVWRTPYTSAQPGDTLNFTSGSTTYPQFVGTGAALVAARAGYADIVITHAPSLEKTFVDDGYSKEAVGRALFYNDYVIVGPTNDPAGVFANKRHDAVGAFEAIAARGASNSDVTFVSRNDNSGTNVQEELVWGLTSTVTVQTAANAPVGDTTRKQPGSGGTYPAWYKFSGLGQGPNLTSTNTCSVTLYPNRGCYTMLDSGTWLNLLASNPNLKLVSDKNSAGVVGGQDLQTNYFHAYILKASKSYPSGVTPNEAAAQRFMDYMVSTTAQTGLSNWPAPGSAAGNPDAYPEYTFGLPSPPSPGGSVTITVTAKYKAPPKPGIPTLPLTLQRKPANGSTWTTVATQNTNGSGVATFSGVTVTCNSNYRVTMSDYADPTYPFTFSLFTGNTSGASATLNTSPSTPC